MAPAQKGPDRWAVIRGARRREGISVEGARTENDAGVEVPPGRPAGAPPSGRRDSRIARRAAGRPSSLRGACRAPGRLSSSGAPVQLRGGRGAALAR